MLSIIMFLLLSLGFAQEPEDSTVDAIIEVEELTCGTAQGTTELIRLLDEQDQRASEAHERFTVVLVRAVDEFGRRHYGRRAYKREQDLRAHHLNLEHILLDLEFYFDRSSVWWGSRICEREGEKVNLLISQGEEEVKQIERLIRALERSRP